MATHAHFPQGKISYRISRAVWLNLWEHQIRIITLHNTPVVSLWVVSSTFYLAQILIQSHFELVSLVLAIESTETVSEAVTQMAVELIIAKEMSVKAIFFFM